MMRTDHAPGTEEPMSEIRIGLLLFEEITQLDLAGPHEVFARTPGCTVHLVAKAADAVRAQTGLRLLPDVLFGTCPQLDVICVPGGLGVNALMEDEAVLGFLREQAVGARYVTSVCTGALVLGAAGLLRGRRATTHWAVHDLLSRFEAIPVHARVVRDGNVITGGGVTAGIDFALTLAAELKGREIAESIQLQLEYAPEPPFDAGSPQSAPASVVSGVRGRGAAIRAQRAEIVARAAARLRAIPQP
jgi:cyclohexyl-isocyanide hydratase